MHAFENKIPPPILVVLFACAMWFLSSAAPRIEVNSSVSVSISIFVLFFGVFFCLAGVVSFKYAKTTVNPLKPETASALVNSGIYKISRNPMYVGLVLVLVAWAVYLVSPWSLAGVLGFILYINRFQITPEERALSTLFGTEYMNYQSKVRRWL